MVALRRTGTKRDDAVLSIIRQISEACSGGPQGLAEELDGAIVAWAIEANTNRPPGTRLMPSTIVCECIDGPYEGCAERISVRARFVEVRPRHPDSDVQLPGERYAVVDVGDGKELFWWPNQSDARQL